MRMFGFLEINDGTSDVGFAIGVRNSHDKTFSLGLTVGYRVFVCDNLAFHGDFTPVTRKHTKHFDPVEVIDVAVGKMQRHFEPMKRDIDVWQNHSLADHVAKSVIFDAFIADGVDAPKHMAREVARHYFEPDHPEFEARNLWTLSNGFTSAFKALEPVPQMKAIASLGPFLALYK
jgi:phytoene dehydrogenase-like protein